MNKGTVSTVKNAAAKKGSAKKTAAKAITAKAKDAKTVKVAACDNELNEFGKNVFNDAEMKKRLPVDVYKKLKKTIDEGAQMDPAIADTVAAAMKDWAIERGATHYSHWFQPLTGVTAEKQDSFLSFDKEGHDMLAFSGKNLIKGESDASSFPSGGLRATFEARGYTTWDCTSPAFLREDATGKTLCIPTAFCAYTGEALDKKTPLLRSIQAIDEQGTRLLHAIGDTKVKHVIPMVGAEQEYFLIDKNLYNQRKDLIYTGHTLFGAMPPKGQELDDHYYGAIAENVGAFMNDLNSELWKLGVPAKTQHNEAAPGQHELAPLYEQCNISTDHNQMTMETMKKVAERHNYVCLLHEKPFAGVNGSGKHNNWSLLTDDGENLFKPRKFEEQKSKRTKLLGKAKDADTVKTEDIRFELMIALVVRAVDRHADLLRQSAADVGNDLRLGANEAPPAIVSIFLGEGMPSKNTQTFKTGVKSLPDFKMDSADRNRTSPFAFTGNKFEFRMVGSSDSISSCNVVLNTIVAESFRDAADEIEKEVENFVNKNCVKASRGRKAANVGSKATGENHIVGNIGASNEELTEFVEDIMRKMTKEIFDHHSRILFTGDGYSEAWIKEAEKRGLPNYPTMVDTIPALTTDKAVKLFEDFGVFTKSELVSRAEIEYESYSHEIAIEARTMLDIAGKQIIPAVATYIGNLATNKKIIETVCPKANVSAQNSMIEDTSSKLAEAKKALDKLSAALDKATESTSSRDIAVYYRDKVVPAMAQLRKPIDELEMIVDKEIWPMPSYGDMLFE